MGLLHLNGMLMGATFGGTSYLGIIVPFEGTEECRPPDPCAPIMFQINLFALGPSGFEPPDPCFRQMATGRLNLTLNADGSVESAGVELNSPPT
jgi:hypothetical protein